MIKKANTQDSEEIKKEYKDKIEEVKNKDHSYAYDVFIGEEGSILGMIAYSLYKKHKRNFILDSLNAGVSLEKLDLKAWHDKTLNDKAHEFHIEAKKQLGALNKVLITQSKTELAKDMDILENQLNKVKEICPNRELTPKENRWKLFWDSIKAGFHSFLGIIYLVLSYSIINFIYGKFTNGKDLGGLILSLHK